MKSILFFISLFTFFYLQISKDIMLYKTTLQYFNDQSKRIESTLNQKELIIDQKFSLESLNHYIELESIIEYEY